MVNRENTPVAGQQDLVVMLARSLFRADKWDPARDTTLPFEWDDQRQAYLKKSRRLMNVIGKDGMFLAMSASIMDEIADEPNE